MVAQKVTHQACGDRFPSATDQSAARGLGPFSDNHFGRFRLTGLWPIASNNQAPTSRIAIVTLTSKVAMAGIQSGERRDPATMLP